MYDSKIINFKIFKEISVRIPSPSSNKNIKHFGETCLNITRIYITIMTKTQNWYVFRRNNESSFFLLDMFYSIIEYKMTGEKFKCTTI